MPDTRVSRILLSIVVASLYYWALFTGHKPAPPAAPAHGPTGGIETSVAGTLAAEARALIRSGDYVKALEPVSKLHDAFPSSHIYIEQLAQTYHHLNRIKDEAALWEEYLLKAPHPSKACPHLGLAYRALGDEAKALDAFTRCLAFDPDDPDAILYLALAEERAGKVEQAAALYTRGLALAPKYTDLRLGLARLALRAGRAGEAKSVALSILSTTPDNPDALLVAGLACLRTGETAAARKYLERGLKRSPGNADLTKALAQVNAR